MLSYLLVAVGWALIEPAFSADLIFNTQEFRPYNYIKSGKLAGKVEGPAGFKKLAAHRVTAVYSNRDVGNAIIAEHRLAGLSYGLAHRKLRYFVGLSKQYCSPLMWEKFNLAAIQLYREKVVRRILDRYNMIAAELMFDRRLLPGLAGKRSADH